MSPTTSSGPHGTRGSRTHGRVTRVATSATVIARCSESPKKGTIDRGLLK